MAQKILWIVVILAVILVLISINSIHPDKIINSALPIRIGAILSLTGDAAPWGEYGKNGINLAVKTINEGGGIGGRKIEIVIEDDHTDPKQSVSAWNKLVSIDQVRGVIGGVFDFTGQPLIPLALSANLPLISPSNFRIPGSFDLNAQSFVMLTDFDQTIRKLEPYIASSSVKKLAVIHFKSSFGAEIAKTLDQTMKKLGRPGIIDETYGQIGNNDYKTTIIKLKEAGVDAVFLDVVANDPLIFLRQANQLKFAPLVMTYNGALDSFANEPDKGLLNNAVILNWEITAPAFDALYQNAYGILPTKSADKYFDSVYVMSQAIASSSDSSQAAAFIAKTTFTTPNSAAITFTPEHAVQDTPVQIQIMKDGTLIPWRK